MCQRVCVLTCQHVFRTYVLTCHPRLHALRTYVLTCQHVLRAYVLMRQRVLRVLGSCTFRAYLSTCLAYLSAQMPTCLCAYMLTCKRASSSLSHLPVLLAWLVSSFDATFFSFFAIVIEVVHSDGKVWQFNEYFINQSLLSLCTPKWREYSWDAR